MLFSIKYLAPRLSNRLLNYYLDKIDYCTKLIIFLRIGFCNYTSIQCTLLHAGCIRSVLRTSRSWHKFESGELSAVCYGIYIASMIIEYGILTKHWWNIIEAETPK